MYISVGNRFGPLQDHGNDTEDGDNSGAGYGPSQENYARPIGGPPEAAPLRNKTDPFLFCPLFKKLRLR